MHICVFIYVAVFMALRPDPHISENLSGEIGPPIDNVVYELSRNFHHKNNDLPILILPRQNDFFKHTRELG